MPRTAAACTALAALASCVDAMTLQAAFAHDVASLGNNLATSSNRACGARPRRPHGQTVRMAALNVGTGDYFHSLETDRAHKPWAPPVGYIPRSKNSSMDEQIATDATLEDIAMKAPLDTSTPVKMEVGPQSMPSRWTPPRAGYIPSRLKTEATAAAKRTDDEQDAQAETTSVNIDPQSNDLLPSTSAPSSWSAPSGYQPSNKISQSISTQMEASSKRWVPPSAYMPRKNPERENMESLEPQKSAETVAEITQRAETEAILMRTQKEEIKKDMEAAGRQKAEEQDAQAYITIPVNIDPQSNVPATNMSSSSQSATDTWNGALPMSPLASAARSNQTSAPHSSAANSSLSIAVESQARESQKPWSSSKRGDVAEGVEEGVGAPSQLLLAEMTRLTDLCKEHVAVLTQLSQGTSGVRSSYLEICKAYEDKLAYLKTQLSAAVAKSSTAQPNSFNTDAEMRAHMAMVQYSFEATLDDLTVQLQLAATEHDAKLQQVQNDLEAAVAAQQSAQQQAQHAQQQALHARQTASALEIDTEKQKEKIKTNAAQIASARDKLDKEKRYTLEKGAARDKGRIRELEAHLQQLQHAARQREATDVQAAAAAAAVAKEVLAATDVQKNMSRKKSVTPEKEGSNDDAHVEAGAVLFLQLRAATEETLAFKDQVRAVTEQKEMFQKQVRGVTEQKDMFQKQLEDLEKEREQSSKDTGDMKSQLLTLRAELGQMKEDLANTRATRLIDQELALLKSELKSSLPPALQPTLPLPLPLDTPNRAESEDSEELLEKDLPSRTGGSAFSKSSNKFAEKLRKLNSEAEEARADVLQPSAGSKENTETRAGPKDQSLNDQIRVRQRQNAAKLHRQRNKGARRNNTSEEVFTWAAGSPADAREARLLLREVVQMQGDATLDMAEVHYSSGGNNLFVSLAAELQRVGMPFKSTVVFGSPDTGSVLDLAKASRSARSQVVMYSSAYPSIYAQLPSPVKELSAAACKFKVEITCFELLQLAGHVKKTIFLPNDGVAPRAQLVLGRERNSFWSTLPEEEHGHVMDMQPPTREIMEIPTTPPLENGKAAGVGNKAAQLSPPRSLDSEKKASAIKSGNIFAHLRPKGTYTTALELILAKYGDNSVDPSSTP